MSQFNAQPIAEENTSFSTQLLYVGTGPWRRKFRKNVDGNHYVSKKSIAGVIKDVSKKSNAPQQPSWWWSGGGA